MKMNKAEFAEELLKTEADAKQMAYFRTMFRFAFERGATMGLNHNSDTLTDVIVTERLNDAIADWNTATTGEAKESE